MRPISLRVFVATVVTALALPFGLLGGATAASASWSSLSTASTNCDASQSPTSMAGQAGLTIGCFTKAADANGNPVLVDGPNARWHNGAVTVYTACNIISGNTSVTCSSAGVTAPAFNGAGVDFANHSVSGNGATGKPIPGHTFVVSTSGASTLTLSRAPVSNSAAGQLWIENSTSRTVEDLACTSGNNHVTSATANFTTADQTQSISATCLTAGTTITTRNSATDVTVSTNALSTQVAGSTDILGHVASLGTINGDDVVGSARYVTDLGFTSGSNTVTSASAQFATSDKGLILKAAGFLGTGCYISGFTSATQVDVSLPGGGACNALKSSTNKITLTAEANGIGTVGSPSITAPKTGDRMAHLGADLALTPTFVGGSPDCSNGATAFALPGAWYNSGAFKTMKDPFGVAVPHVSGAMAQVVFSSSVSSFAGYLIPTTGGSATLKFPSVPVALANCGGQDYSSFFTVDSGSVSQSAIATGVGRPATAQIRALRGRANTAETSYTNQVAYADDKVVNESQRLLLEDGSSVPIVATAGTFTINAVTPLGTCSTASINAKALTAAVLLKALMLAPCIGNDNVVVTGNSGTPTPTKDPWDIKFVGALGGTNIATMTVTVGTAIAPFPGGSTFGFSTNPFVTANGSTTPHSYNAANSCTVSWPAALGFPCNL